MRGVRDAARRDRSPFEPPPWHTLADHTSIAVISLSSSSTQPLAPPAAALQPAGSPYSASGEVHSSPNSCTVSQSESTARKSAVGSAPKTHGALSAEEEAPQNHPGMAELGAYLPI